MFYKPSAPYCKEFTTASPTTGAATNADSLPVATANRNGSDDGAFTLTVTNIDAGRYKITGTVPSGYAAGDVVNVTVAATVAGVAGKACVDTFGVDTKRVSDSLTVGTVGDKTGYSLNLSQIGLTPRALDAVADSALTVGDALVAALCAAAGRETVSGTSYVVKTPSTGTTIRSFTLDSAVTPTTRS